MNPHAMFSSGYKDTEFTITNPRVALTTFVNRIWRITRFDLNVEM